MGVYNNREREMNSAYQKHVRKKIPLIAGWARQGLTYVEIADLLGISVNLLKKYREKYQEFEDAIQFNRAIADTLIENALFKRALGYKYKEKIYEADESGELVLKKEVYKQVLPEVKAQIFWLTNRKKEQWQETPKIDVTVNNQQAIQDWLAVTGFDAKQVNELYNDEEDVFEEDLKPPPRKKVTNKDAYERKASKKEADEDDWEGEDDEE